MDLLRSAVLTDLVMLPREGQEQEDGEVSSTSNEDFLEVLLQVTQNCVRQVSIIPTGTSYSIQTSSAGSSKAAHNVAMFILAKVFNILRVVCPNELSKGPNAIASPSDLLKNYEKLVDTLEFLLAKVDKALIVCNNASPESQIAPYLSSTRDSKNDKTTISTTPRPCTKAASIENSLLPMEPQSLLSSATLSDNQYWKRAAVLNFQRFVPFLTCKFHGLEPLPSTFFEAQQQVDTIKMKTENFAKGLISPSLLNTLTLPPLPHPYQKEIQALDWGNLQRPEGNLGLLKLCSPKLHKSLEDTPLVFIETKEDLSDMIEEIQASQCTEIAIDLEHHSQHSYYGVTCLIQLSTRHKDFIIDPIELRGQLVNLNKITADPSIVKVLHGSDSDVLWLQRDFSVYVVNLFDTGQAARVLEIPGGYSLANLLFYYCKVYADKQYQLSDWRQRPLPQKMIHYARSDTHFLLYIYDKVRNDLLTHKTNMQGMAESLTNPVVATEIGKQVMRVVLERSRELSVKCYEQSRIDFESLATQTIGKHKIPITPEGFSVLCRLFEWRDNVARVRDMSPNIICNSVLLLRMAEKIPRTWSELQSVASTLPKVMKEKATEVLSVIKASLTSSNLSKVEKPPNFSLKADKPTAVASGPKSERKIVEAGQKQSQDADKIPRSSQVPDPTNFALLEKGESPTNPFVRRRSPKVSIFISSTIRKKNSGNKGTGSGRTAAANALEIHLADVFSYRNSVSGRSDISSLGPHAEGTNAATQMRENLPDRKIFARAISALIERNIASSTSSIVTRFKRKRRRNDALVGCSSLDVTNECREAVTQFDNQFEMLKDKMGRKRSTKSHAVDNNLELDMPAIQLSSIKQQTNSVERPIKKRKLAKSAKTEKVASVLSEDLLKQPTRKWRKGLGLSYDEKNTASDEKLKSVQDVLPASMYTKQNVVDSLALFPVPQFFGSSAALSSKTKSTAGKRKKK